MPGPRVLITGRYGFTGRYVADELSHAGFEVWGTGVTPAPQADPKYISADLNDPEAIAAVLKEARPEAVLHLAAIAFVNHGRADDFYKVNLLGTRCLLEALASSGYGQKAVVLASTANIYGNTETYPIVETTLPAPANDYAVSKLSMEYLARLYAEKLPLIIARPFNYTGRGQDHKFLVPKIVSHFLERKDQIELGNLDVARDFSDVRDVAIAYRQLIELAPHGAVVNICSGFATELREIIDLCRQITGHEIKVTVNPAFVRGNEIKKLVGARTVLNNLTGQKAQYELEHTLAWMLGR